MEAIYIPKLLKAPDKKETVRIDRFIAGLKTLTPVRGEAIVAHRGHYLEISVEAEAITTLQCDRCLQQYNHRLLLQTSELIWLDPDADRESAFASEREISLEDLSESLSPQGYFDLETWLYEQLCLAMPLRQLCSPDCEQNLPNASKSPTPIDSRWASLEALRKQL